jgi:hypothetical protein
MGLLDDLAKIALPAVASSFLGPVGGTLFGGITQNPAIQNALLSGGIGLLTGQKPKDALKSALLGGIGQTIFGGKAGQAAGADGQNLASMTAGMSPGESMARFGNTQAAGTGSKIIPAGTGTDQAIEAIAPRTMSAELLKGIGAAGDGEGNLLYKVLNTQLGEGLAAGLVAQLLAGDDKEDTRTSWEKRPYAGGKNYGQLGGANYNQGGMAYYPRRDGGIDPNEGSGTKDDVPAMLTAGEFVMTRDAVQGAGGGDLRQGIDRMYNMMDKFERMA